jgi:hypothetical protein
MGKYSMDMSKEQGPAVILPEGWNEYIVKDCKESLSKKNNEMFIITLALEKDESITGDVYAISTPGKRWFLKNFLAACEVPASEDGVYDWDISDVIGKIISGKGESSQEKWIDREGTERTSTKTKIVAFNKSTEVPF